MQDKKYKNDFKVEMVYCPSPDAEERLQKAFAILLKEEDSLKKLCSCQKKQ